MSTIRGTIQDGKVVFDSPTDWPEGTEVSVEPLGSILQEPADILPNGDDASPEAIARRLALMDRVEPWMTMEEEAAWKKQREEDKAAQLAMWNKWNRDIEKVFE